MTIHRRGFSVRATDTECKADWNGKHPEAERCTIGATYLRAGVDTSAYPDAVTARFDQVETGQRNDLMVHLTVAQAVELRNALDATLSQAEFARRERSGEFGT